MDPKDKNQQELLSRVRKLALQSKSYGPPSKPTNTSSTLPAKLKEDCDEAATNLSRLQNKLSKKGPCAVEGDATREVLKERERLLLGHCQASAESEPLVLPESTDFQQTILIEQLEKNLAELIDTLAWVKAQREDTKNHLESESQLVQEREDINTRLRERIDEVDREGNERRPNESILAEIKEKETVIAKYSQKLMQYLRKFTQEHFPAPSEEDVRHWRRKRKLSGDGDRVLSLLNILEEIMNQSVEVPNNPYIMTDGRYWDPYLHLLVRVGIIQRHPEDSNRIKMTPFHL